MQKLKTAILAGALTLASGVAMAQSYGNGDPAWADTTDPGSVPTSRWYRSYGPDEYYRGGYVVPDYDAYGRPYQANWRWSSGYQLR